MRELEDGRTLEDMSLGVHSVIRLYTINEPLLPNLTTLGLWAVVGPLFQFLPLFLSATITSISLGSLAAQPKPMVAAAIANLPKSCPYLQDITLHALPRDPMITAAASEMLLATTRNALWRFNVDSPLTEEAREAVYKLQDLRSLSVVIEKGPPIPSASLPNLTCLEIECEDGSDGLQLLRRATFGKLECVHFHSRDKPTDDFLEAFKGAALSSSIQNTLSGICITTDWPWNPNYSSLLPFTQLVVLNVIVPCGESCSGLDDDILIDLSCSMPRLRCLRLGDDPCNQFTGGVTAKGLVALAHNCQNLRTLCVHFQADIFSHPPMGLETAHDAGHSTSWTGCALTDLEVGWMLAPEGPASMVAVALLRIFPRLESIHFMETLGEPIIWDEIERAIRSSLIVQVSTTTLLSLEIPR